MRAVYIESRDIRRKNGRSGERIDYYGRIVRQLAEEYDAVFVPLQEAFDKASSGMDATYWIWDGVHPTAVAMNSLPANGCHRSE